LPVRRPGFEAVLRRPADQHELDELADPYLEGSVALRQPLGHRRHSRRSASISTKSEARNPNPNSELPGLVVFEFRITKFVLRISRHSGSGLSFVSGRN